MRLTLRFDADLIPRVRKYADSQGTTLNQLIRDRLEAIASGVAEPYPAQPQLRLDPTPKTTRMRKSRR